MLKTVPVNLPSQPRIETGGIEFSYSDGVSEWPGLFIRGDDAISLMLRIRCLEQYFAEKPVENLSLHFALDELRGLREIIDNDVIVKAACKGEQQP